MKLAVIFPGIGYNSDKPLLYYSIKMALARGYEVVRVEYSDIDKSTLKDREKMPEAISLAIKQTEAQLKDTDFASCEHIIFVSKSIGTIAASAYAAAHSVPARQVYFTPFPQTISTAQEGNGLVFFGDKDPWVEPDEIRKLCDLRRMHYRIIDGGNHSLETGQVYVDVDNMSGVIHEVEDYLFGEEHGR